MDSSAQSESSDNTIEYQLSRKEIVTQLRRMMIRPSAIASAVGVSLAGVALLILRTQRVTLALGFIAFPLLLFLFYGWVSEKIVTQHPEFLEKQLLSFNASGIRIANSVTQVHWPWTRVRRIVVTDDFYLILVDHFGSGAAIPKRALTVEQQEQLLAFAKRKLPFKER
jgi:hypothetical protein